MTMTTGVPPELETRLQVEADRRVAPEDLARLLLEEQLPDAGSERLPFWATASREEWVSAFNAWMYGHDPTHPPLSDEAISRESIYAERG